MTIGIEAKLEFASEGKKISQRSNECKTAYFGIYRRDVLNVLLQN